jgi:hypothetical protein
LSNLTYAAVTRYLEASYSFTPEDLFKLSRTEKARLLKNIQVNVSADAFGWKEVKGKYFPYSMLEPGSFKNTQKKSEGSTRNQASNLLRRRDELGGHFTLFVIELGSRPVSSETMEIATRLSDMLFGDLPRLEKLEQGLSRNTRTHLQGILLSSIDWGEKLELNGYVVKFKELGKTPEYQGLPIEEQVKRFVRYLKKPYDSKVLKKNKKFGLKPLAVVEWFERAHSEATGESSSFRTSRGVNLGQQKVRYPEEFMKRFFFEEVSDPEEES